MTKLIPVALLLLATACNTPSNEPAAVTAEPAAAPAKHDYGIKAGYSTDFSMGDPAQGDIIVKMWKLYDENKVAESKEFFADSVIVMFPGYEATLQRDSLMVSMMADRNEKSAVSSSIDVIIPVKANDKDENAVLIWGKETATTKGKALTKEIHEVWIFNKAGKITTVEQYLR